MRMRDDLDLNAFHHIRARMGWLRAVGENLRDANDVDRASQAFVDWIADRKTPHSSVGRALLAERGYSVLR